jgi:hypothetical protein
MHAYLRLCTLALNAHARSFVCTLHARSCVLTLTLCLFTILASKLHLLTLVYALFTYASLCDKLYDYTLMHAPFTDASNAYASYALFRVNV